MVTAWDPETGERHLTFGPSEPPGTVWDVEVSPDGELVAAAGDAGARVSDAVTGEELFLDRFDEGRVRRLGWSPDSTLLALARDDGIRILDRSGRPATHLQSPSFWVGAVRFSPDGRLVAAANIAEGRNDPTAMHVRIWDWEHGTVVTRFETQAWNLAFHPGGERIAVASGAGLAEIYDVESGRRLGRTGDTGDLMGIDYGPDGSRLATGGADGTVRLWDAESGVLTLSLRGHTGSIWTVALSPDGSKLASASFDGTVRVWALDLDDLIDIANGKLTRGLTPEECRQYLHMRPCPTG